MKSSIYIQRNKWILMVAGLFAAIPGVFAQTPTHYPTGKNPQPFTFWNVFFYIVIPVILVIAWIWIRRYQAKRAKNETGEDNGKAQEKG